MTDIFTNPTLFISEWYRWGAAVAFAITFVTTLWIFFDSQSNHTKATLWRASSLLAAIVIIPSAILSLFPDLASGLGSLPALLAYLGPIATLLALISLLLYTVGIGVDKLDADADADAMEYDPVSVADGHANDDKSVTAPEKKHSEPITPVADKSAGATSLRNGELTQVFVQDAKKPQPLAWVVSLNGTQAGKTYRLGDIADIGRDSKHNDISLDDRTISRQHARIRYENEEFVVYDLVSVNGISVNGETVERRVLSNGDRILVGQSELGFMQVREEEELIVNGEQLTINS